MSYHWLGGKLTVLKSTITKGVIMAESDAKEIEIKINPDTVVGSKYAQVVVYHITDIDVTLDFVYVHPRTQTEGRVVARVTLPVSQAEQMADTLKQAIKTHEQKSKKTTSK